MSLVYIESNIPKPLFYKFPLTYLGGKTIYEPYIPSCLLLLPPPSPRPSNSLRNASGKEGESKRTRRGTERIPRTQRTHSSHAPLFLNSSSGRFTLAISSRCQHHHTAQTSPASPLDSHRRYFPASNPGSRDMRGSVTHMAIGVNSAEGNNTSSPEFSTCHRCHHHRR